MQHIVEDLCVFHQFVGMLCRNANQGICLARNGICQAAAFYLRQVHAHTLRRHPQEAGQLLVGVGAAKTYFHARMAAVEAFYLHTEILITGVGIFRLIFHGGDNHLTAGAAYYKLSVFLAVEVQQNVAVHKAGLQAVGAYQTLLFVYCKQTLQRTMLNGIVEQHGHSRGAAKAIVCS